MVAESEADATSIVVDLTGCDPTDVGPWKALAGDSMLTVRDDDGGKEAKTCAEWAAEGRGMRADFARIRCNDATQQRAQAWCDAQLQAAGVRLCGEVVVGDVRTTVARHPMWLCVAPDCGGIYSTVQDRCVCGAALVERGELMPATAQGVGARIRSMLESLVAAGHTVEEDRRGYHHHGSDALRRSALDHAGFCWLAPGELAPSCGCAWAHDRPEGPRHRLAESRAKDLEMASQWERVIASPCPACGAEAGQPCQEVAPFSWHVMRKDVGRG